MRITLFAIFRIHKYSFRVSIKPLLNSLYCYIVLSLLFFTQYKEYMVCLILFRKFSDVLPAFVCARAIGNL